MSIKAIETRYAGCHFRSRLEARWAILFDTLEIRWEYEPQGWDIDGVRYLPDFLLPNTHLGKDEGWDIWVEVKGAEAELDKPFLRRATEELGSLLILGPIPKPPPLDHDWYWPLLRRDGECGGDAGLSRWHKNNRPWWGCCGYPNGGPKSDTWLTPHLFDDSYTPEAQNAYTAARSARFEHGQHGQHGPM